MLFRHDFVTDGHSHSRSFSDWLRCEKWVENLFLNIFRYTTTIISDRNFYPLGINNRGSNRNLVRFILYFSIGSLDINFF